PGQIARQFGVAAGIAEIEARFDIRADTVTDIAVQALRALPGMIAKAILIEARCAQEIIRIATHAAGGHTQALIAKAAELATQFQARRSMAGRRNVIDRTTQIRAAVA